MTKDTTNNTLTQILASVCTALALCACSSESGGDSPATPPTPTQPTERLPIRISCKPANGTADNAFATGDRIGLFVVNRNADGSAATLRTTGNHVDNGMFSLDGTWTSSAPVYWKDRTTHADFYMYHPYMAMIASTETLPWSVKADQSDAGSYKASLLLMGKALDVAPSEAIVSIGAEQVMAQVTVTIAAGKGFTEATLATAQIGVRLDNLKTQATVNIATAQATATGGTASINPCKDGGQYKAIVVPQTLGDGSLITVTVDGTEYGIPKAQELKAFEPGHRYELAVTVSKASSGLAVGIAGWKDDGTDHGGTAEPEQSQT